MFEDRTYDTILAEMLEEFGTDVRTDEGSLAYNACSKIALKLEEAYADLDEVYNNMNVSTMDLDHLILYADERGISYNAATYCTATAVFGQTMSLGDLVSCGDYEYELTSLVSETTNTWLITCTEDGTGPNTVTGELAPVDYIEDWVSGEITEVTTAGTDDEELEHFRARVISSFQNKAFGGNKADYQAFVDDIDGVGGCKPVRASEQGGAITIYVQSDSYGVPSDTLINTVQTAVDPTVNSGGGDGMAPICHTVIISPVESVTVGVNISITVDSGTAADYETQIKSAISSYMETVAKGWEASGTGNLYLRAITIEATILTIDGIVDITSFEWVKGSETYTSNLPLNTYEIPAMGEVVVS